MEGGYKESGFEKLELQSFSKKRISKTWHIWQEEFLLASYPAKNYGAFNSQYSTKLFKLQEGFRKQVLLSSLFSLITWFHAFESLLWSKGYF